MQEDKGGLGVGARMGTHHHGEEDPYSFVLEFHRDLVNGLGLGSGRLVRTPLHNPRGLCIPNIEVPA